MTKTPNAASGRQIGDMLGRLSVAVVVGLIRHWLLVVVIAIGLYVALPLAAPVLMRSGHEGSARLIYALFRPLCHQLPERSFFLYGQQLTYSEAALAEHLGGELPLRYAGDAVFGYKAAVCQRDVAIYSAMFLGTVFYALFRRPVILPNWMLAVCAAPMAVDGGGQLVGLWASSPASRVITGVLFGLGLIWWALPRLDRALKQTQLAD